MGGEEFGNGAAEILSSKSSRSTAGRLRRFERAAATVVLPAPMKPVRKIFSMEMRIEWMKVLI